MLADLPEAAPLNRAEADIVIVGAGAVGLAIGVELARRGRDVLILEAGGKLVDAASQAQFELSRWSGRGLHGLHVGRFRALGGTTSFWGGQVAMLDPVVFEPRPWVSEAGWPFGRETLDPYYDRAFDLLGLARRLPDEAVWRRLGVQPPDLGDALEMFFTRWLPEPNFVRLFAADISRRANLRVLTNAQVTSLTLDPDRQAVTGVVVNPLSGPTRISAARVILANGTVEIARLLALPGPDGRAQPWATNPWLGKGFSDHLQADAGRVEAIDRRRFHDLFDNGFVDGLKYHPKLKISASAQRRLGLTGAAAEFTFLSDSGAALSDAKVFFRGLMTGRLTGRPAQIGRGLLSAARVGGPMLARYLGSRRMFNPTDRGIRLAMSAEHRPLAASRLDLLETRDAQGAANAQVTWTVDGGVIETLAWFAEAIAEALSGAGLARVTVDPALKARDGAYLDTVIDGFHQMGLARMAVGEGDGVVDADLKVHGMANLHVAGAAVFPTTGFENPTFTAIALGLRLCDTLCRAEARAS
jgi:choline dehydrogenase-like flavoprotein